MIGISGQDPLDRLGGGGDQRLFAGDRPAQQNLDPQLGQDDRPLRRFVIPRLDRIELLECQLCRFIKLAAANSLLDRCGGPSRLICGGQFSGRRLRSRLRGWVGQQDCDSQRSNR